MSGSGACIFCKIIKNEIPSPRVYEDAEFICIRDVRPQASVHLLVLPKKHLPSLVEAFPASGMTDEILVGRLFGVAARVAREQGLSPAGFRSIINTGISGGQTVFHLHLHILGGELLPERLN